jgi:TetR/AcrR family transcriptional regulator, transcriptional repressor of aconitase
MMAGMPKVSEQYRDARREQILRAARRVFQRNGFHATSMQDLFAEAKLSSGAVYRYFRSKDDVVLAIARDSIRDVITMMSSVARERNGSSIGEAIAAGVTLVQVKDEEDGLAGLAVQVWGEALRNAHLREPFAAMLTEMKAEVVEVIRHDQRAGRLPVSASPESLASVLVAILPGCILQLAMVGPEALSGVPDALRALWPDS